MPSVVYLGMASTNSERESWYVYLLECAYGTYYCGVAKDVEKRLMAHRAGKGAKYTRGRLPVRLVAVSPAMGKSDALKMERLVKAQRDRRLKPAMVRGS